MIDVNVPLKSNKHKNLVREKNIFFVGILKVNDEKSRIQHPDLLRYGPGSVPKCHRSGKLVVSIW
jgi:hypothetical protein